MKDKVQQKYLEYQLIFNQITQIRQQYDALVHHLSDLENIKEGLDEVSNSKEGKEILVSLGPGVFMKASLKNNKDAIMSVGSGVAVDKGIKDIGKVVGTQIQEVKNIIVDMENELSRLNVKINALQQELTILSK